MAYSFTSSSTQYISCSSLLTLYPSTFAGWVYMPDRTVTTAITILSLGNSANSNVGRILVAGSGNSYNASINANNAGVSNQFAYTTLATSTGVWQHICGVFSSSTSRTIYLDGGSNGSNTTSAVPVGLNTIRIGSSFLPAGGPTALFNGIISDTAIWNVELTIDEIKSLSKGFSPRKIRPQSLEFYSPLIRDLNEQILNSSLTNNNTAIVSNHQRIYL